MRRTALMLIITCIVLSGLTLVAAQKTITKACLDNILNAGIKADNSALYKSRQDLNTALAADQNDDMAYLVAFEGNIEYTIKMRQKYEDIKVAFECDIVRQGEILYLANSLDKLVYAFMSHLNTPQSDHYAQMQDQQVTRLGAIDDITNQIATEEAALVKKLKTGATFTPGGKVATKAPVTQNQVAPTKVATAAIKPTIAPTVAVQPTAIPQATTAAGGGATALCNDGTYSYSAHHSGSCAGHGGVKVFYK